MAVFYLVRSAVLLDCPSDKNGAEGNCQTFSSSLRLSFYLVGAVKSPRTQESIQRYRQSSCGGRRVEVYVKIKNKLNMTKIFTFITHFIKIKKY